MKTYVNLSDALYDTFKDVIGTADENRLDENLYIKRKLKEAIGTKEYNKFDALDEKYWKDSWREFDIRTFVKEVKN